MTCTKFKRYSSIFLRFRRTRTVTVGATISSCYGQGVRIVGAAIVGFSFLLGGTLHATSAAGDSSKPVIINVADWTGSRITSTIVAKLLRKVGDDVTLVPLDGGAVFPALESGDLTVAPEVWSSAQSTAIAASLATHKVVSLGDTGLVGLDRWWYPDYVKTQCPGLPDWHALNTCAKVFATLQTGSKGQLLLYPASWGGHDDERIKSLGLDLQIVRTGSEAALLAQVKAAYLRHQPILAWLYEPHWAPLRFHGEYVQLPPYTDACYSSGKFDCEKPAGPIMKLANVKFSADYPRAAKVLEQFSLTNAQYDAMVGEADVDGKTVDAVADEWLAQHKDQWSRWIAP
jgi:glycine betaine/proline transport system substrate-binding protein